jgi:DNA-directed RNA polymerase III subunit RPC2
MLGSTHCHLNNKSEKELARMNECIHDPKGYFILKGTEKVVLIHEQMAKNRIFVEFDSKTKSYFASVQSKNFETISKTKIIIKDGKLYVKANSFTEPIPIFILFKAMKIESEYVYSQILGYNYYDRF